MITKNKVLLSQEWVTQQILGIVFGLLDPKDFWIILVSNLLTMSILDEGYFRKINSPSVAVGYDISPLKRVKLRILTTSRHASG